MRWIGALLIWLLAVASCVAETIRVTTWNLEWFPSGSPNLVAPEVESGRIQNAARVISILNPDVLLLQEVRDLECCQKLANALKPLEYQVVVCSAFKEAVGGVVGRQQVVIMAKRPAEAAWAETWKSVGSVDPPRGYAFALIRFGTHEVGFYSLHLKSNLVRGGDERQVQLNILKRELAAEQVVAHADEMKKKFPRMASVVIGGDFNTNPDQDMFVSEKTLGNFTVAGYKCDYLSLPLLQRVTHPGQGRYPDCTFDYLFARGLKPTGEVEITPTQVSDHRSVTVEFQLP